MNAEDQARYGRVRTMCEFMTNVASAMEYGGGLSQVLKGRIEESVKPVREAREWLWDIGQTMILSRPLPAGLHEALEIAESHALEALPKFKAAMDEACDEFSRAGRTTGASRGGELNVVILKAN